jgi:hypothetical protein
MGKHRRDRPHRPGRPPPPPPAPLRQKNDQLQPASPGSVLVTGVAVVTPAKTYAWLGGCGLDAVERRHAEDWLRARYPNPPAGVEYEVTWQRAVRVLAGICPGPECKATATSTQRTVLAGPPTRLLIESSCGVCGRRWRVERGEKEDVLTLVRQRRA